MVTFLYDTIKTKDTTVQHVWPKNHVYCSLEGQEEKPT